MRSKYWRDVVSHEIEKVQGRGCISGGRIHHKLSCGHTATSNQCDGVNKRKICRTCQREDEKARRAEPA